eukprot:6202670-Pleurochrysis_carterae.AAC.1
MAGSIVHTCSHLRTARGACWSLIGRGKLAKENATHDGTDKVAQANAEHADALESKSEDASRHDNKQESGLHEEEREQEK